MNKKNSILFEGQYTIQFEELELPPIIQRTPSHRNISTSGTTADNPANRHFNYISFGSGSSGNSCYIGNKDEGIIVDVGVRA